MIKINVFNMQRSTKIYTVTQKYVDDYNNGFDQRNKILNLKKTLNSVLSRKLTYNFFVIGVTKKQLIIREKS